MLLFRFALLLLLLSSDIFAMPCMFLGCSGDVEARILPLNSKVAYEYLQTTKTMFDTALE